MGLVEQSGASGSSSRPIELLSQESSSSSVVLQNAAQSTAALLDAGAPRHSRTAGSKSRWDSGLAPPADLKEHAERKGYFSVSDLVGPAYCEVKTLYNIIGLSHLPVEARPSTIRTPLGAVIQPNVKIAVERERTMDEGRKVHKKLEEELHPVTVRVRTRTREDAWALRYLRLITGLRSLLDCGCVRELPVFGFVEGRLVMGVIDEVIRRELPALPSRDAAGPSQQAKRSASSNTSSPTKKWASQDEWRRQSARRAATDKSPGKAQPSLASFFGGASAGKDKAAAEGAPPLSQVKRSSQAEKQSQAPAKRFGFYISDTKTRLSNSIPYEDAQQSARMQVALYKRLLDGLVLPYVAREGSASEGPSGEPSEPVLDPHATELSPAMLFAALDLDAKARLSSAFAADAEALCESYDLQLLRELSPSHAESGDASSREGLVGASPAAEHRPTLSPPGSRPPSPRQHSPASDHGSDDSEVEKVSRSCTLEDVARLFAETVEELLEQAAQSDSVADGARKRERGAFQAELELQYRLQASAGRFRRRKLRESEEPRSKDGAFSRRARGGKRGSTRSTKAVTKTATRLEQSMLSFPPAVREASAGVEEQDALLSDDAEAAQERADLALALQLSIQLQEDATVARDEDARIEADAVPLSTPSQRSAARGSQSAVSGIKSQSTEHISAASPQATSSRVYGPAASESQLEVEAIFAPAAERRDAASSQEHVSQARPSPFSSAPAREAAPLIGIVRFTFAPAALDAHLRSVLALWSGAREPRGVGPGEVYRCRMCEYEEGCEWLSAKAQEARLAYEERKRAREALAAAPRDLEDEEALWTATHGLEESASGAQDPDADLWERLDVPAEALGADW